MLTNTALDEPTVLDTLFEVFTQKEVSFADLTRSSTGYGCLIRLPDGSGILLNGGCDGLDFGRYNMGMVALFDH
jgi:hypothetical protein